MIGSPKTALKESLLGSYNSKVFHHGEILFREGNLVKGLMFIYTGKVKIFRSGIRGKAEILRVAEEGDFLGYNKLIEDSRYKASAEALEDTIIIYIPQVEFQNILR